MRLNYVVARLVPDLIREEPINIGVIAQSNDWAACRFIERIPKNWGLPELLVKDIATNLNEVWRQRIASGPEMIYIPGSNRHETVRPTQREYLEWLVRTYTRHFTFSDIREADVEIREPFEYNVILERLYNTFVAPVHARPKKAAPRSRLHTQVKNHFKHLKLPLGEVLQEKGHIQGNFAWPVDFIYRRNGAVSPTGQDVAIGLLDLGTVSFVSRAKDLLAMWADVKEVREDAAVTISVIGGLTTSEDHRRAVNMIKPCSDQLYYFELERDTFFNQVQSDLLPTAMR